MKVFGWAVAIGIVLYLIGRSRSKPAGQSAEIKSPADNLIAQTSGATNTAADLVYKLANQFVTPLNSDLVDKQPVIQNDVKGGDYVITRPVHEKLAGIPEFNEPLIPKAEKKWWPDVMYLNQPWWADHYPDDSGECVCGNGCQVANF